MSVYVVSFGDCPIHVYTSVEAATMHVMQHLEKSCNDVTYTDGAEILRRFKALVDSGWTPLIETIENVRRATGECVGGLNFTGDEWFVALRLPESVAAYKELQRTDPSACDYDALCRIEICTIRKVPYTDS